MEQKRIVAVRTGKTIYRDGDKLYKVFEEKYKKSDILNEALNHARIEESGLTVPILYEVGTIDGKWSLVYQYIKGKTLEQLMDKNPEKIDEYLDLFVNIQMEIHSKSIPHLNKIKDKVKDRISICSDLDATTRYELHTRLASMPTHDHVIHGDFNPSNVIISDEDKKIYVIDWSHASQGNSSYDAAMTYLLFQLSGNLSLADKYLEVYCKKTSTPLNYVQTWIPLVAAARLATCKKDEVEFIKHALNIYDHE